MSVQKSHRKYHLKKKYNLTLNEYDSVFIKQNGVCAICHLPERATLNGVVKRLAVDHDHKTGVVRGLLCNSCNGLLGVIADSLKWLRSAQQYLK